MNTYYTFIILQQLCIYVIHYNDYKLLDSIEQKRNVLGFYRYHQITI